MVDQSISDQRRSSSEEAPKIVGKQSLFEKGIHYISLLYDIDRMSTDFGIGVAQDFDWNCTLRATAK